MHSQDPINAVLLTGYADGFVRLGAHSDNEPDIVTNSTIHTVSLGARRTMRLTYVNDNGKEESIDVSLGPGDLLLMEKETQSVLKHEILQDLDTKEARISLTYRSMKTGSPPKLEEKKNLTEDKQTGRSNSEIDLRNVQT